MSIYEVGDKISESMFLMAREPHFKQMLLEFFERGLKIDYTKQEHSGILSGKTFLVTGTLSQLKRSDAEKKIKESGGRILSSVSKNLNYLVVGDSPGSKLEKAEKINKKDPLITILDEDGFLNLFH